MAAAFLRKKTLTKVRMRSQVQVQEAERIGPALVVPVLNSMQLSL